MANKMDIYKCRTCSNIIEVVHGGSGTLVCCDSPMQRLDEKTADEGKEKHVPVIEKIDGGYEVKVGSIPHPMEEKHYIELIELITDDKIYTQFLSPGDVPEAQFNTDADAVTAREHCTIHGLWKGQ